MKYGMNLLLWTGSVVAKDFPQLPKLLADDVEVAAQVGPHRLIARLRDKGRFALFGGRVKAGADQTKAGVFDRAPCLLQLAQHVIGPVADIGLQLDLFGEDL